SRSCGLSRRSRLGPRGPSPTIYIVYRFRCDGPDDVGRRPEWRRSGMAHRDLTPMNPLVLQRADPCVLREGSTYYFTASHPQYDRIILRRADSLDGLQAAEEVTI